MTRNSFHSGSKSQTTDKLRNNAHKMPRINDHRSGFSLVRLYHNTTVPPYVLVICLVPILFAAELVSAKLPPKYFYDSTSILAMVNGDKKAYSLRDPIFQATVNVYRSINVFGFNTMTQWRLFLGITGCILLVPVLLALPRLSLLDTTLILCMLGLADIYVFQISKDMIQFLLFYILAVCLYVAKNLYWFLYGLMFITLMYGAVLFRNYYVLIAILFILFIFIFALLEAAESHFHTRWLPLGIQFIIFGFIFFALFLAVMNQVAPSAFHSLATTRAATAAPRQGSADAQTVIVDLIPGSGLDSSLTNTLINAIRMMIPVELLVKSSRYLPFVLFQLLITGEWVAAGFDRKLHFGNRSTGALLLLTAFFCVSFLFEPDFGSWAKHESTCITLICLLIARKKGTHDHTHEPYNQNRRMRKRVIPKHSSTVIVQHRRNRILTAAHLISAIDETPVPITQTLG